MITTDFVTIDLAGFTISGPAVLGTSGIIAPGRSPLSQGLAVRNGSIQGFGVGVALADNSIVEGLRVAQSLQGGIQIKTGIVRGNTVINISRNDTPGIAAGGTVTGNFSSFNAGTGFVIAEGSTVIGNTATNNGIGFVIAGGSTVIENTATNNGIGITVQCPSNVTSNTAVFNSTFNLFFNPSIVSCNNTNNSDFSR